VIAPGAASWIRKNRCPRSERQSFARDGAERNDRPPDPSALTAFVKDNHEVVTPDFHSDVAFGYNTGHGGTASDWILEARVGLDSGGARVGITGRVQVSDLAG